MTNSTYSNIDSRSSFVLVAFGCPVTASPNAFVLATWIPALPCLAWAMRLESPCLRAIDAHLECSIVHANEPYGLYSSVALGYACLSACFYSFIHWQFVVVRFANLFWYSARRTWTGSLFASRESMQGTSNAWLWTQPRWQVSTQSQRSHVHAQWAWVFTLHDWLTNFHSAKRWFAVCHKQHEAVGR